MQIKEIPIKKIKLINYFQILQQHPLLLLTFDNFFLKFIK